MTEQNNPCHTCPDSCCALKGHCGLRLSKDEFETFFRDQEQDLNVRVEDKIVIISTKDGLVCPNLGKKGCRIYEDRPIDCRLYPYQMLPMYETRRKAKFMLYLQPNCVQNETFLYPEEEARALVEEFGRKVYGDKRIVVQTYRDRFLPKLRNKCEVLFVKFCMRLGLEL
jgi:Fe-S-cluster containining protein